MPNTNTFLLYLKFGRLALMLLLLISLGGCLQPRDTAKEFFSTLSNPERNTRNMARLNCFLNLMDNKGPAIRLEVAGIEVFVDNLWLPFISEPLIIESASIGNGQRSGKPFGPPLLVAFRLV